MELLENSVPINGISPRSGTFFIVSLMSSCMRPPSTIVWRLSASIVVSMLRLFVTTSEKPASPIPKPESTTFSTV